MWVIKICFTRQRLMFVKWQTTKLFFGTLLYESQLSPVTWSKICNGSTLSCKVLERDLSTIGVMTMTKSFTSLFAFSDDYGKFSGQLPGEWKIED